MPFASFHLTGFADGGKVNGSWWGQLVQGKFRNESFAFRMQKSLPSTVTYIAHLPACFLWLFLGNSEGPTGTKENIKEGVNYVPMMGMVSWIHTNESGLKNLIMKKTCRFNFKLLEPVHLQYSSRFSIIIALKHWTTNSTKWKKSECSRFIFFGRFLAGWAPNNFSRRGFWWFLCTWLGFQCFADLDSNFPNQWTN